MSIVTRGLGDPQGLVTRGLGAGISTLAGRGGAVVTDSHVSPTDIAIIEDLVTAVEDALAPVVTEFLTETGLEIEVSSAGTLSMSLDANSAISMSLAAEALQVQAGDAAVVESSASESGTLSIVDSHDDVPDTESAESSPTTINTDEQNAGA